MIQWKSLSYWTFSFTFVVVKSLTTWEYWLTRLKLFSRKHTSCWDTRDHLWNSINLNSSSYKNGSVVLLIICPLKGGSVVLLINCSLNVIFCCLEGTCTDHLKCKQTHTNSNLPAVQYTKKAAQLHSHYLGTCITVCTASMELRLIIINTCAHVSS